MQQTKPDTLILCPTKRFARGVQQHYANKQLQAGQQSFAALNVQTLEQWLGAQLDQAMLTNKIDMPPRKLSAFEERYLWQAVIRADLKASDLPDLFDVQGLANNCIEANRYCVAWRLALPENVLNDENRAFLRWQAEFAKRCEALNALEAVRYFDWQLAQLAQGAFSLPPKVAFAGFDQTAPLEQKLRDLLAAQGVELSVLAINDAPADNCTHAVLQEQTQEIQAMMAWVKQQREAKPAVRLAIVVPQLQSCRQAITDALDASLQAETFNAALAEAPRHYNVSLGEPLSQQPMVETALQLVRLVFRYQFDQADLSPLLLSPYWSASLRESDARALLEARLRDWLPSKVTWKAIQKIIETLSERLPLAQLSEHLAAALAIAEDTQSRQTASDWAAVFQRVLTALQWPGERVETSHEYQTREAWEACLEQFGKLDFLGERLSASQAVQLLSQLAQEQVFQAETTGEPTIQVLGIMEALSAPVDAMWVMGMNDNQWPMPARPNPLLPAAIQREAKVANADDSVQMAFAKSIHQRLLHSAQHIVFSSSDKDGEKELRASPLMADIPKQTAEQATLSPLHAQWFNSASHTQWEWLNDTQAPAVAEGEHVKGGTGLIQAQAICPAWAFYQYRLGARALRIPKQGFDAVDRGELVHDALEYFWMHDGTPRHYADLTRLSEDEKLAAVQAAVEHSIARFKAKQGADYSPQLWVLESGRMLRLINDWLDYELTRAVNFTVLGCEVAYQAVIQGVEVTLKIDRVHALPEGGLEIIDYKTGAKPSYDSWGTERITNPQLPIYASYYAAEQSVSSVQFGMVKTKEHAYVGVAEANFEAEPEKRKPKFIQDFDNWAALKAHWQQSIDAIVSEIKAGEAGVVFENADDLRYCEVLPLLRLQERAMQFETQTLAEDRA